MAAVMCPPSRAGTMGPVPVCGTYVNRTSAAFFHDQGIGSKVKPHDQIKTVGCVAGIFAQHRLRDDVGDIDPDDGVPVRFGGALKFAPCHGAAAAGFVGDIDRHAQKFLQVTFLQTGCGLKGMI